MFVFVFANIAAQAQQNVKTSGGKRGRKNKKIKMAVLLRRSAAAAAAVLVVAAVCADGASTFYSSDPNLGSARVVFQVTRHLLYLPLLFQLRLVDSRNPDCLLL
jgi:hypothetical protein